MTSSLVRCSIYFFVDRLNGPPVFPVISQKEVYVAKGLRGLSVALGQQPPDFHRARSLAPPSPSVPLAAPQMTHSPSTAHPWSRCSLSQQDGSLLTGWLEAPHPSALSSYFSDGPGLFWSLLWASLLPAGSPIPALIILSLLLPPSGLPAETGTSQSRDCWRLSHWCPQGPGVRWWGGPDSGPALTLPGA